MTGLMENLRIYPEEQPHKTLRDKAFHIFKNLKHDGYRRGLASMAYKFFDKKPSDGAVTCAESETLVKRDKQDKSAIENNKFMPNQELAEELHKPIIRAFGKRKVYSSFEDYIWGADHADMQLISKYNKDFVFIMCH